MQTQLDIGKEIDWVISLPVGMSYSGLHLARLLVFNKAGIKKIIQGVGV